MRSLTLLTVATIALVSTASAQTAPLVVHEWGTFTSLQDETGRALGAINQDTEPLPDFVKNLNGVESVYSGGKGIAVNPAVTMRLETPVVYFHPPPGSKPFEVDFSAAFHGGLLTQYYPDAEADGGAAALKDPTKLDSSTVGTLRWRNVTVGSGKPGPATTSRVWLAPRKVDAADLTASNGDNERYLFYRGVGHLDSPLKAVRAGDMLRIVGDTENITKIWYFDVRADGSCAFRSIDPRVQNRPGVYTFADFKPEEYQPDSLHHLRTDMRDGLIKAGLFEDEANAMLNTWEEAYFKSPGTRLFFIVPREWVDSTLPIKLSVPAKIERVMVGRVDLVTPAQRQLAQKYLKAANKGAPEAQQMYKELGRFAGPIVNDEMQRPQARAD